MNYLSNEYDGTINVEVPTNILKLKVCFPEEILATSVSPKKLSLNRSVVELLQMEYSAQSFKNTDNREVTELYMNKVKVVVSLALPHHGSYPIGNACQRYLSVLNLIIENRRYYQQTFQF